MLSIWMIAKASRRNNTPALLGHVMTPFTHSLKVVRLPASISTRRRIILGYIVIAAVAQKWLFKILSSGIMGLVLVGLSAAGQYYLHITSNANVKAGMHRKQRGGLVVCYPVLQVTVVAPQ